MGSVVSWTYHQHLARAQHQLSVERPDRHTLQSSCSNSYLPNGDTEVYGIQSDIVVQPLYHRKLEQNSCKEAANTLPVHFAH